MSSWIGKEVELEVSGRTYLVKIENIGSDRATVVVDGKRIEVGVKAHGEPPAAEEAASSHQSAPTATKPAPAPSPAPSRSSAGANTLCALMPGVVVKTSVVEGQEISTGDVVLILEAMKMENEIRSDRTGKIAKFHAQVGQQVQAGDPLVTFA